MKKELFLGALLLSSFFTVKAQDNCAEAMEITAGTYTVDAINGIYEDNCWDTQATVPNGEWYSFTPTENGWVRVNTNLPSNVAPFSVDTRVSIYTGSCGTLDCYTGIDDVSDTNFLSDFEFPAEGGETYYIVFDDRWSNLGFEFEVTFEAESCFPVFDMGIPAGEFTESTATFTWSTPIGNPVGYQIAIGPQEGFTPIEEGILVEATGNEHVVTGLEPATIYQFYGRSHCGGDDYSDWYGPFLFSTAFPPVNAPYTTSFENNNFNFGFMGWETESVSENGGVWAVYQEGAALPAQDGTNYAGIVGTLSASDAWMFSTGVNLQSANNVTVNYWVRKASLIGDGGENNLTVTLGNGTTPQSQYMVLGTFTDEDFNTAEFALQSHTFTVPVGGTYYLGFHYTAPAHTAQSNGGLLIDSVEINSVLGTEEVLLSQFSIFPNPASDVINIADAKDTLINQVNIVDLNGRTVKSAKYSGVTEAQINISDLASGMYMMTVTSDKGTITKKIVKD